jgi:hypothetical protein
MTVRTSLLDRFGDALFGFGPGEERVAQRSKGARVPDFVSVWLVALEARR